MKILSFSLKMLLRNYRSSIAYGFMLLLSIIAIFLFGDMSTNPTITGITQTYSAELLLTSVLPSFVILLCWIMIIYVTNYFFNYKGKEFSLLYLSGATLFTEIRYILYQILWILLLVIPVGMLLGYLLTTLIYTNVFLTITPIVHASTYSLTLIALLPALVIVILCVSGYVYRTNILDLIKGTKSIRTHSVSFSKKKSVIGILVYIASLLMALFVNSEGQTSTFTSYVLIAFIGLYGFYLLLKHTIPQYAEGWKKRGGICKSNLFVGVSYFLSSIKNNLVTMAFLLTIPCVLTPALISQSTGSIEHSVTMICFIFLVFFSALALISKFMTGALPRLKEYRTLYYLGYTVASIKKIINIEVVLFYLTILLLPMPLILIIGYKYITLFNQSIDTFIFVSLFYILPIILISLVTKVIYVNTIILGGKIK